MEQFNNKSMGLQATQMSRLSTFTSRATFPHAPKKCRPGTTRTRQPGTISEAARRRPCILARWRA